VIGVARASWLASISAQTWRSVTRGIVLFCVACAAFAEPAPPGDVIGVGNFTHLVADLDRSIEFYRDRIGLELLGPQGKRPFAAVPAIQKATNTPGPGFASRSSKSRDRRSGLKQPSSRTSSSIRSRGVFRTPAPQI
jgi:hypothetical protein